jgi:tRNA-specific 2-thiouridylase
MVRIESVYVAMSGGVDSAVTAALLLERGYDVTGIYMRTWRDPHSLEAVDHVPSPETLAREVADALGVPFVVLDVREAFYDQVVRGFIGQYLAGETPNPCLFCNPRIKWGILQAHALEAGAAYFATGHYARLHQKPEETVQLLRGRDAGKDQSYVLSMLSQVQLRQTLLPLGEMTKDAVREKARQLALPVADREDSQDLCFLGDVDYRDFLARYAPDSAESGEIINLAGTVVGRHEGLAYYTIGQRRGLGIAAPEPYYVVDKDIDNNRLVVAHAAQTGRSVLLARRPNWISGKAPAADESYEVMIRYRANPVAAKLDWVTKEAFRLAFDQPVRGIAAGQVAALYQGDQCLGGGVIDFPAPA